MRSFHRSTATSIMILCFAAAISQGEEQAPPPHETTPTNPAAQQPKPNLPTVILLGDSIRINYQGTVKSELEGKATVWTPKENCAHTFFTLENLEKWIKGRNASVVHINVGLHDLFLDAKTGLPRHSLETYSTNLRAIFTKLNELTDAKIIFALTTPVVEERQAASKTYGRVVRRNPLIVEYNRRAQGPREIAKECGVRIDDLHSIAMEAGAENVIREDGVHLSEKGIALIGEQVARCVLSVLDELASPTKTALHKAPLPRAVQQRHDEYHFEHQSLPQTRRALHRRQAPRQRRRNRGKQRRAHASTRRWPRALVEEQGCSRRRVLPVAPRQSPRSPRQHGTVYAQRWRHGPGVRRPLPQSRHHALHLAPSQRLPRHGTCGSDFGQTPGR